MSKVKFDFSDVDSFFDQGYAEVKAVEDKVGKEAVDYAVKNGNYQNQTAHSVNQTSTQSKMTAWS
jgi:hypothetical protein